MAPQDAILMHTEPARTFQIPKLGYRRQRKSRQPQIVKDAVLIKKSMGLSNTQIAEDLEITRQTVGTILNSSEIMQHVGELRSDMVLNGDLVKSVQVMRKKLRKGSESAATTILRGFNVLQSNPRVEINIANVGAQSYAQRMMTKQLEQESAPVDGKISSESSAITVNITSVNDPTSSK